MAASSSIDFLAGEFPCKHPLEICTLGCLLCPFEFDITLLLQVSWWHLPSSFSDQWTIWRSVWSIVCALWRNTIGVRLHSFRRLLVPVFVVVDQMPLLSMNAVLGSISPSESHVFMHAYKSNSFLVCSKFDKVRRSINIVGLAIARVSGERKKDH
jgi:hypothetical protein